MPENKNVQAVQPSEICFALRDGIPEVRLKLRTMATAEVALKSPWIPLFKGGIFRALLFPLFGKEGEGEIFSESERD